MRKSTILAIVSFIIFLILRFNYSKSSFKQFDQNMSQLLYGNDFLKFFHLFGSVKFIVLIGLILILYLWIKGRDYRGIIFVLLTIGVGTLLNQFVKNWVERPRPELANQLSTYSFPSAHAMLALLLLFTISYMVTNKFNKQKIELYVWGLAIIITILTGFSRVVEGRHYATDIIAGWTLGYTWFFICYMVLKLQGEKAK